MKHGNDTRPLRPLWRVALAVALTAGATGTAAAQGSTRMAGSGGGISGGGAGGASHGGVLFRTDVPSTATRIAVQPAVLWRATAEVLSEMGLAMSPTSNPASMDFVTTFSDLRGRLFNRPNSEFFACNSGDMLNNLTATGRINMALRARVARDPEGGNGSVLYTQIDARAQRRGTSASAVECDTTGKLEARLAQQIEARAQEIANPARPAATPAATPAPR